MAPIRSDEACLSNIPGRFSGFGRVLSALSALLLDGQPFGQGDAERICLAQFGIALLADQEIDPIDEFQATVGT